MTQTILFLCLCLLGSKSLWAAPYVIYGEDNRTEVHLAKNPLLREAAYSTAAMIAKENLFSEQGGVVIKAPLLKEIYKLCSTEKFREQISAANCSGTLIDKDLILTAGHCYSSAGLDCKGYRWVFDFRATSSKQSTVTVPESSVYKCKEIVAIKDDRKTNIDYALIRLDRPVEDRAPVRMRMSGTILPQAKLGAIGHPRGVPTKIADSGEILENQVNYMRSNLDTYTNNSGSGVFNEQTGELEGILISGKTDFVSDSSGCLKSQTLPPSEGGEYITKVQAVWPVLK